MDLTMGVGSSAKKHSVYDFDGEEEPVEITPRRFIKIEKPKKNPMKNSLPPNDDTRVDKYTFLQSFTHGTKEQGKNFLNEPVDVDDVAETVKDRISASDAASQSSSSHCRPETYCGPKYLDSRDVYSGSDFSTLRALGKATGQDHLDSTIPHFLSDKDPVHINSDDDNEIELSSTIPSSDLANPAGPSGEQVLEHGSSGCDIEPIVVVSPRHVSFGKKRYWHAQLTFSCSCIKLDVSTVNGITEPFILEWKTADLVKIESKWRKQFKTANVCLHLKSEDEKVADNAKTPGIVELRFAVCDPLWSQREEAIKLLDVRYIDKWDDSNFDASFEDVIYPEGDPDSISISKRDIELLQPERFINDTIVDFYIKYLKNKVKPEDNHRFHFFNSFFFRKLADFDSNCLRACRGREAFQRVRKWTKKVNLFQKDYIFIPVNFSLHWSLIVICHPGEVVDFSDEETEKSVKVPCILHMDSIKGSHRGLKNLIQSYVLEEWKERSTNFAEDVASKFLNLRFLPLELPQQQNSFDCGLFMLHYMELFVEQAPVKFSPFRLSKSSRFLNKDWFPPAAASLKRAHIKKLVFEIAEHNLRKVPSSACGDKCSSEFTDLNKQVTEEFLQEAYNSKETCHESYLHTNAVQPFNLTPLAAKPLRSVYIGESDFGGFPEPGLYKGSPIDGNDQPFGQMVLRNQLINVMSPIEEDEETSEQTACSPTEAACDLQLALISEPSAKMDAHWSFAMLPDSEESEKEEQISGTDSREYPLSSEIHKKENYTLELSGSSPGTPQVICECSSASSDELEACVIKDSQEENGELDASFCEISRCQRRLFALPNQKGDLSIENIVPTNHTPPVVPCIIEDSQEEIEELGVGDNENYRPRRRLFDSFNQEANSAIENTNVHQVSPMLDFEEVRSSKRPRLMSPRTERRATRSLSKGIEEIVIL